VTDFEFACRYSVQPIKCELCGRILYEGDDYRKYGYGGFICGKCENKEDEDEIHSDD
jgi:hypothetical protein